MTVIETFTIKPTSKYLNRRPAESSSPVLPLHALDLFAPVHISHHLFFHNSNDDDNAATVTTIDWNEKIEVLKSSLAEALELYPPVAGTIRCDDHGVNSRQPYVALDGEGASFMVERRDSPFTGDGDDISPRPVLFLPTPSRVLAVKVTAFSCGTMTLASSLHHYVADLCGFLDFLGVWATIARGGTVDLESIPHDWSRTPARFFSSSSSSPLLSSPPPIPEGYTVVEPSPSTSSSSDDSFSLPETEVQTWRITASDLTRLKTDFTRVLATEESNTWISSGDALTALLWGVNTRARQTANIHRVHCSQQPDTEMIAMAADGRERSPDKCMTGGHYFGNFNVLFMTTVPSADLLSMDTVAGARVALAIRKSIDRQLSTDAIAERIRFMEAPEYAGRIRWGGDLVLTNWCRFDLCLDFGWGRPFDATGGEGALPPAYVRLQQQHDNGDVTVVITIEREGGHAMKSDALLNKYATLLKIR